MASSDGFFRDYDLVLICGCFRFGSTALAQKMAQFFMDHGHATLFLNEFFTAHHYLTNNDGEGLKMATIPRDFIPFGDDAKGVRSTMAARQDGLFRAKLDWLRGNMGIFKLVVKVDPDDWLGTNGEMLERCLLDNPRVYRIGLNRQDVGNAIISFLISTHFGFMNFGSDSIMSEYSKPVQPVTVKAADVQPMVDLLLSHNNWLWHMRHRLDRLIWHDEIEGLRLPDIGMDTDTASLSARHPVPHDQRLRKYFINHEEVAAFAAAAQANLDGLVSEVRRRYNASRSRL